MLRALLIMVAVSALAALPCLVLLLISLDEVFEHVWRRVRRRRARRRQARGVGDETLCWRERRRLARLDRSLGPALPAGDDPTGPPIEKLAVDLRRLRRQRTGIALRSPVWFAAIEKAYDDRLRLACQRLAIDEHLGELTGVDRDIERVRLEGALEAAGLTLHGYEAAPS